jgi:glycine/D-amino acid oxidase-like deaminating enzyme
MKEGPMIEEADAIVIGAGAFGTSVAFHLVRRGLRRVALLDKDAVASQTSPRAAGLTSQVRTTDTMTRLAMMSVRAIARFTEETGEPLVFYQPGSLKIARTPEHAEQLRAEVERGRRIGLEIGIVSPAEAHRLMPFLEPVGIQAVTYSPSDLYLEPVQLPLGYARAAERLGATVLPQTPVTGFVLRDGGIAGVQTARGPIRAPVVVDAAGAWTRLIGEMAGARIPLVPTRHQLLITEPLAGVTAMQPITRIIDVNVYVRPEQGGLMLGGYEPDPVQYGARDLRADFQISDLALDIGVLRRLADGVAEQFPIFQRSAVRSHRGGLPTMTADGQHIVGPVAGVRGLFVAGGCCVGGLSISPAVGEVLAEWIVTGDAPMDLSLLAPDRFGPEYASEERLKAACRWQYAHHYSA